MNRKQWLADAIRRGLTRQQLDALGSSERVEEYCRAMAESGSKTGAFDLASLRNWTPDADSKPS